MGMLRPNEIAQYSLPMAERYAAMVMQEIGQQVIEGGVRSRSIIVGDTKPGTFAGEATRTVGQLKSFPVAFVMTHLAQIMRDLGTPGYRARGARYAAQLIIGSTVMAYFIISMKDIAAGRDPRRWLDEEGRPDPNMLMAAFLQSGGGSASSTAISCSPMSTASAAAWKRPSLARWSTAGTICAT